MDSGGLVGSVQLPGAIIEPEGNVDAGDFFQLLIFRKEFGKQRFSLTKIQKRSFGILLAGFERDHPVRLPTAADAPRKDGGIGAVGAEGGSGVRIGENFTAAGGAEEGPHGLLLFFRPGGCL